LQVRPTSWQFHSLPFVLLHRIFATDKQVARQLFLLYFHSFHSKCMVSPNQLERPRLTMKSE